MVWFPLILDCVYEVNVHPYPAAGYPNSYTPSEEQMLAVYSTEAKRYGIPFSKKALNYAKAVTCLRLIAFVQVRYADTLYIH